MGLISSGHTLLSYNRLLSMLKLNQRLLEGKTRSLHVTIKIRDTNESAEIHAFEQRKKFVRYNLVHIMLNVYNMTT